MDPTKVYTRPPAGSLTPVQKRAFDIVDGFLSQQPPVPALLDFYNKPDHKVIYEQNEDGTAKLNSRGERIPRREIDVDERVDYWLLVKRGNGIYRLHGWEKGQSPKDYSWSILPLSQWKQELVLKFAEMEKRLMGEGNDPQERLPLTASDFEAIGIGPEEDE